MMLFTCEKQGLSFTASSAADACEKIGNLISYVGPRFWDCYIYRPSPDDRTGVYIVSGCVFISDDYLVTVFRDTKDLVCYEVRKKGTLIRAFEVPLPRYV